MNQQEHASGTDVQRTALYNPRTEHQRLIAAASFALAAAVVATLGYGLHTSSAKSATTVSAPAQKAQAVAVAVEHTAMPVVQFDTVIVRPTAQQLAELEQLRQARLARANAPVSAGVVAGAAASGAGL